MVSAPLRPVEVAQCRGDLDAEHEAAAELARFGEPRLERRHLVQRRQLVEDHPDAPPVVLGLATASR